LALTGGIREADLLFAQACLDAGATVQILLLEPTGPEIAGSMWGPDADRWAELLSVVAPRVTMLCHETELGPPMNPAQAMARHNRWLMNTAKLAAEAAKEPKFYGIVFTNEHPPPEDTDCPEYLTHAAFFIASIRSALAYQGKVATINPAVFLAREKGGKDDSVG
jgi:hypothetical protein